MAELLKLTNDYVFKSNFGYKGRENTTRVLLKDIFRKDIKIVELDNNTITEKEINDDKIGIMDVKAIIDNSTVCDIEMQVVRQKDIIQRILFYWSKIFSKEVKAGESYSQAKKTICILIANFELNNLQDIKKYISRWNLREEEFTKKVLTNMIDIYIIELPKVEKYGEIKGYKNLNLWVKFINNPEVFEMKEEYKEDKDLKETVDAIIEARKNLEKLSENEHACYLADLREKYILDQNSLLETGYSEGLEAGLEQGKKEGIEQGKAEQQKEIAKKMLDKNIPIDTIVEVTGLSKEEIEKLK